MSISKRWQVLGALSLSVALGLLAGCSSDPQADKVPGPPIALDYHPAMAGTENFAEGKVVVKVTLGLPTKFRPGEEGGQRRGSGHAGPPSGGHRGGGMNGGHGGMEGGGYGSEGTPPEAPSSGDDTPRPRVTGSNLPPAQLKLNLQNTSGEAIACEVLDFNSSLGNFAVFPSRYQLEAGQSLSSEAMTSRLGVQGSEIPVTVALRVHDQVEKKVITLRLLPVPAKPPAIDAAN